MPVAVKTVREATFDVWREYGLTSIFANPGSTEIKLLTDLPDDFRFAGTQTHRYRQPDRQTLKPLPPSFPLATAPALHRGGRALLRLYMDLKFEWI